MKTFSLRNILSLAAVAPAAILLTACAVNPVSGERDFVLISEDQEIAMGAQGAQSVAATIGEVNDPALQQYVQTLGERLAVDSSGRICRGPSACLMTRRPMPSLFPAATSSSPVA
jgi:predicted Zn-dependent protease